MHGDRCLTEMGKLIIVDQGELVEYLLGIEIAEAGEQRPPRGERTLCASGEGILLQVEAANLVTGNQGFQLTHLGQH
ncbi:hypothetical protein D3C75_1230160 [compost metagenome]